jgi:hypothetical protein
MLPDHERTAEKVSAPATGIPPALVDTMIALYCEWRTASRGVQLAYEHVWGAASSDRAPAFAAYTAALDREESACEAYAESVHRITVHCASSHGASARRRERGCLQASPRRLGQDTQKSGEEEDR